MSNSEREASVAYVRRVYDQNFEWYKNADTKAQIILTLDGVFLAFITSSIFIQQTDLNKIIDDFTIWTWGLLAFMSLALILSISLAIGCLWSRVSLAISRGGKKYLDENTIDSKDVATYKPEATFFFQYISWLDRKCYQEYLLSVDGEFEVSALASAIHDLSGNVLAKHRYVNWSFTLAGASLILFFLMGISYIQGIR